MEFENLTLDRCIEMWKKENKHVTIHACKIQAYRNWMLMLIWILKLFHQTVICEQKYIKNIN